jgi:hypothetical protein
MDRWLLQAVERHVQSEALFRRFVGWNACSDGSLLSRDDLLTCFVAHIIAAIRRRRRAESASLTALVLSGTLVRSP